jgi:regulator of replication initiation timing
VNKDHLFDELGRIERDVVHGERQLAEQEQLLASLKSQNEDLARVQAVLEELLLRQQALQQERLWILSLLQP